MCKEEVTFKGTKEGLLIMVREDTDFLLIKKKIEEKLKNSGNFFSGATVQIDLGSKKVEDCQLKEIKDIVASFGLHLEGILDPKDRKEDRKEESGLDFWTRTNGEVANSLLIKRTLRSGQRINYDGNIVILGDVNPGAEVVAAGDIIVLGKLRGVAHAGAGGNEEAIVVAFRLQPIQLRIAQYITRSPDNEEIAVIPNGPEIARVKDSLVVIEPY